MVGRAMKRHFKDWIEGYVEYTKHSEAPDQFHQWTAVATIAGALRRRVRLEMGYFRWFPNFYLCFVAPPGIVSKSTTADIGMSLLRRVDGIKFGPSTVTWQALITSLAEAREDYPLGDGSFVPMCAITLVASELGTLLKTGDQSMLDALTDLWDAKEAPIVKATKKDGEEIIINPWINIVGCTTPAWIAASFDSYFIGGGFASRTLFCYSEHKRQLVAYPASRITSQQASFGDRLVADLTEIASMEGAFSMDATAVEWGTDWYQKHFASDNPLRLDPRFGGYFARKQTHIHKTAMVLSVSRRSDLRITRADLEDAAKMVTELEPNMLEVFGEMNKEKITEQMAQVLNMIRDRKKVRRDTLYQEFLTIMGYDTFSQCITGLMQSGLVEMVQDGQFVFLRYKADNIVQKVTKGVSS